MVAIALFTVGVFLLIAENLNKTVDLWQGAARVSVYIRIEATDAQVKAVDQYLASRAFFNQRKFVTREEAMNRFKSHFSSLANVAGQLDSNPFPPSFEIRVNDSQIQNRTFDDEIAKVRRLDGVEDVQFDWQWIAKVKNIIRVLNLIGLIVGGILALAAAFTTANVIRLSMVLYREEISIMRLVGATEGMVRGPFLLQGVIQGTLGAILAVGLLFGVFEGGKWAVQNSPSVLWDFFFVSFLPWQKISYLLLGGMLAGILGSWFSLSDFGSDELPTKA
jgi:cell division transport system permease protein